MNPVFKRFISSVAAASLFGFVFGVGISGLVLFLNKTRNMLPEMMLVTLPESWLYSLGGFDQTPAYQKILERFGWWPTLLINGFVMAAIFMIIALISKAILKKKDQ